MTDTMRKALEFASEKLDAEIRGLEGDRFEARREEDRVNRVLAERHEQKKAIREQIDSLDEPKNLPRAVITVMQDQFPEYTGISRSAVLREIGSLVGHGAPPRRGADRKSERLMFLGAMLSVFQPESDAPGRPDRPEEAPKSASPVPVGVDLTRGHIARLAFDKDLLCLEILFTEPGNAAEAARAIGQRIVDSRGAGPLNLVLRVDGQKATTAPVRDDGTPIRPPIWRDILDRLRADFPEYTTMNPPELLNEMSAIVSRSQLDRAPFRMMLIGACLACVGWGYTGK